MKQYPLFLDGLRERLADPRHAAEFLTVSIEEYQSDHDLAGLVACLRVTAEAQGRAEELGLAGDDLDMLTDTMTLRRLEGILAALGVRLHLHATRLAS